MSTVTLSTEDKTRRWGLGLFLLAGIAVCGYVTRQALTWNVAEPTRRLILPPAAPLASLPPEVAAEPSEPSEIERSAPAPAAAVLQFVGYYGFSGALQFAITGTDGSGTWTDWFRTNEERHDFVPTSFDAASETLTGRYQGNSLVLGLVRLGASPSVVVSTPAAVSATRTPPNRVLRSRRPIHHETDDAAAEGPEVIGNSGAEGASGSGDEGSPPPGSPEGSGPPDLPGPPPGGGE